MPRIGQEKVLLIGDAQRDVQGAVAAALPGASVTAVADYFDGIAELSAGMYTTVLASAEPVERRPEAAVRTLRELCGDGRLILFGQPSLEGLARKMLEFGADDYLITPANPGEIQQMLGAPVLRVAQPTRPIESDGNGAAPPADVRVTDAPTATESLQGLPLAEVLLDALLQHPADAPAAGVRRLSAIVGPTMRLAYQDAKKNAPPLEVPDGVVALSHQVRATGASEDAGTIHLLLSADQDAQAARHLLAQIAGLVGKVAGLQDRHNGLYQLAITDQLTGVSNRRHFEHFLAKIIAKATTERFPVTLLLFDIDDFKKYNDTFGHGAGDQILKETATLIKRCCREHDLVARIGGDEFAVVFWEKEGPRLPKDAGKPPLPAKPPQTPRQVFARFKRLMASAEFPGLGANGKGVLTISGGLATFPWDARNMAELIQAADYCLMQKAKRGGKDRLYLVGDEDESEG
ncbi:MAG TPA: GGDEF domain-containing protein [Tepidisphaeraceae bacterium]|nr:GGDEF domain-containing protein [Tepidisphaeraceae bacterium]